jgi:urease accessory protein
MAALAQLLLSDGRFPAGGYAHSAGLEAAVEAGLAVADVPAFMRGRLAAVAGPEAALAVAAMRASSLDELLELDAEAVARTASPPLRVAARRLGAQLLRTAMTVWPDDDRLRAYRDASATTPRPVVFGVVAAAAQVGARELAEVYLYEDAASVATAAVRLLPVDAAVTMRWLLELESDLLGLAAEAAAFTGTPPELPTSFAPLHELRSLVHARREGRLFAT